MTAIVEKISKLRNITGVGFMACKKALEESNGDIEKAIVILREKGYKVAQSRINNETNEGVVMACVNDAKNFGVIATVKSETDFVANSTVVIDFLNDLCKKAANDKTKDVSSFKFDNGFTVNEELVNISNKVLEKVCLDYIYLEGRNIAVYNHFDKHLSVLLSFDGEGNDENFVICKDVCLNIAATKPLAIKREDVKKEIVEEEIKIAVNNAKAKTSDEAVIQRIADGKLENFYKENVLLEQNFVKDGSTSIKEVLDKKGITLVDYKYVAIS